MLSTHTRSIFVSQWPFNRIKHMFQVSCLRSPPDVGDTFSVIIELCDQGSIFKLNRYLHYEIIAQMILKKNIGCHWSSAVFATDSDQ